MCHNLYSILFTVFRIISNTLTYVFNSEKRKIRMKPKVSYVSNYANYRLLTGKFFYNKRQHILYLVNLLPHVSSFFPEFYKKVPYRTDTVPFGKLFTLSKIVPIRIIVLLYYVPFSDFFQGV